MNKLRILIISRSFYPIIAPRAFRATELAKELSIQGHDVTVLTNKRDFNYTDYEKEYKLIIEDFVQNRWHDLPQSSNFCIKLFKKILKHLFLYPDIQLAPLLANKLAKMSGFDLLISIAVPYSVHWGVALAKQKNRHLTKVWIADCGDPFMGNKESKFNYPFYFKFVENWFCKKPDFITVPISGAIPAYPSFCHHKIEVIPQGFNFDEVKLDFTITKNEYPIFAYAGAMSKGVRDPSHLLDYLSKQEGKLFKFIIYTQNASLITPYKDRLGNKLVIRNYVQREQLLSELSQVDFLVNLENRNNVQSPSKLIDYAITQKPIISIKPDGLDETVLTEFLDGNYTNRLRIDNLEKYDIRNVAKQFILLSERKYES